ncbi:hypothetical protein EV1_032290 [Malus domestica]
MLSFLFWWSWIHVDTSGNSQIIEVDKFTMMELSSLTQANISLLFITATAYGLKHIETTLTRAKFEELCLVLLDRCEVLFQCAQILWISAYLAIVFFFVANFKMSP